MGECWHNADKFVAATFEDREDYWYCRCGKLIEVGKKKPAQKDIYRPRLSTWEGFGKLWEWAQKQEWWRMFIIKQPYSNATNQAKLVCINTTLIHPDHFADALYTFLKEKQNG